MAFSAAENTRVGGVRKNASDAGMVPHLSASMSARKKRM